MLVLILRTGVPVGREAVSTMKEDVCLATLPVKNS